MAVLTDGRQSVNVVANKTLALTDCGTVQNVQADGITITLLATIAGATFTIRNGGVPPTSGPAGAVGDQSLLVTIQPNSSDQIAGLGFTATDNKTALNTKATAKVGDEITLVADATNGWVVTNSKGTWARGA
jgi:hypothetical protein